MRFALNTGRIASKNNVPSHGLPVTSEINDTTETSNKCSSTGRDASSSQDVLVQQAAGPAISRRAPATSKIPTDLSTSNSEKMPDRHQVVTGNGTTPNVSSSLNVTKSSSVRPRFDSKATIPTNETIQHPPPHVAAHVSQSNNSRRSSLSATSELTIPETQVVSSSLIGGFIARSSNFRSARVVNGNNSKNQLTTTMQRSSISNSRPSSTRKLSEPSLRSNQSAISMTSVSTSSYNTMSLKQRRSSVTSGGGSNFRSGTSLSSTTSSLSNSTMHRSVKLLAESSLTLLPEDAVDVPLLRSKAMSENWSRPNSSSRGSHGRVSLPSPSYGDVLHRHSQNSHQFQRPHHVSNEHETVHDQRRAGNSYVLTNNTDDAGFNDCSSSTSFGKTIESIVNIPSTPSSVQRSRIELLAEAFEQIEDSFGGDIKSDDDDTNAELSSIVTEQLPTSAVQSTVSYQPKHKDDIPIVPRRTPSTTTTASMSTSHVTEQFDSSVPTSPNVFTPNSRRRFINYHPSMASLISNIDDYGFPNSSDHSQSAPVLVTLSASMREDETERKLDISFGDLSLTDTVEPSSAPMRRQSTSSVKPSIPLFCNAVLSDEMLHSVACDINTTQGSHEIELNLSSLDSLVAREEQDIGCTLSKKSKNIQQSAAPQDYLDAMIFRRGYSTERYSSLDSGYHNDPTTLQESSYRPYVLRLVDENDIQSLRVLLSSGLSTNPSNYFGSTLAHYVCRLGRADLLQMLMEIGCDIRIADGAGRTPLHEVCRRKVPCFPIVDIIMRNDVRLFHMSDSNGAVPLARVPRSCWADWNKFLDSKMDQYWPHRDYRKHGDEPPPPLALLQPNTRPMPDPKRALMIETVQLLASGKLQPSDLVDSIGDSAFAKYRCRLLTSSASAVFNGRTKSNNANATEETDGIVKRRSSFVSNKSKYSDIEFSITDPCEVKKEKEYQQFSSQLRSFLQESVVPKHSPKITKKKSVTSRGDRNVAEFASIFTILTNPGDDCINTLLDDDVRKSSVAPAAKNQIPENLPNNCDDDNVVTEKLSARPTRGRVSTEIKPSKTHRASSVTSCRSGSRRSGDRRSKSVTSCLSCGRRSFDLDDLLSDDDSIETTEEIARKKESTEERRRRRSKSQSKRRRKRPSFYVERVLV